MPYKNPEDKLRNNKKYQAENRTTINAGMRRWRNENPDAVKEQQKRWRENNPEAALILNIRNRCKASGVPFNLTKGDIVFPETCPVLGIKIDRSCKETSPSLDRLDPSLGYVKGNVCMISQRANRLKQDATKEELEKIIAYIVKHKADKDTPTV